MVAFEIRHYVAANGRDLFGDWLDALADRRASAVVLLRVARLQRGLFGDCKPVGAGVWELRIDFGPGYRVYFARAGVNIVLLLCGGDKRRQDEDIARAKACWSSYARGPAKLRGTH